MAALSFAHDCVFDKALQWRMTSALDIVDAQLHLALHPAAAEIEAQMAALGIQSVVLDEYWGRNANDLGIPCAEFANGGYRPLSPLALAATLQRPSRFSFLQRITRRDPKVLSLISVLATTPGCRALRLVLFDRGDQQAFIEGGCDDILRQAQSRGLPLCVLSRDAGSMLRRAASRYSELQLVVDHCGWPKSPQDWNAVLELARFPNVTLKWSHAWRAFARQGEAPADQALQTAFMQALGAFGVERVLWAADVTHDESGASWGELLAFVRDNPALAAADKAWILGRTSRRVFGWPPA